MPKCWTKRLAVTGPTPLISPEPRYFSRPVSVAGFSTSYFTALNCGPCLGWLAQVPTSLSDSPAVIALKWPTTVTRSAWPGDFRRATV